MNEFLTYFLTIKGENEIRSQAARLRHSIAQDKVYIATSARAKTPKRLLLPSVIKTITNTCFK